MSTEQLQRIMIWLLIVAAALFMMERLFLVFKLFATPLLLFGLAWLIALALRPIVDGLTRLALTLPASLRAKYRRLPSALLLPRSLAVTLVYLALLAVIVLTIVELVPVVGPQIVGLQTTLPDAGNSIANWAAGFEPELERLGLQIDFSHIAQPEALMQQGAAIGTTLLQQSLGIASSIATLLVDVILILILSFYMTLDGPRLALSVLELMPTQWREETRTLFEIMDRTFGGFLRAQIVQALIYALANAVLMIVLGLPDVALASLIAVTVVLIPVVGGVVAMIAPLLIALLQAPDRLLLTLVGLLIIQQVLFNMVMPRLMGKIVGLHPLLVFAAILVGATLAGAWGILFGIPIAGVLASVLQFFYVRTMQQRAAELR